MLVIAALAVLTPILGLHDPLDQSFLRSLEPPSARYVLGTDELGRDMLSRLIWGARLTLGVALSAVIVAAVLGSALGMIGAFAGGTVDLLLMRLVDAVLAFPGLLLVIGLVATLGPTHGAVVTGIAVSYAPIFARLARAMVLREQHRDYVLAARTIGQRPARIVTRHILPNVTRVLLVQATLSIGQAMLAEASLSYLGLANQPWEPSWGRMVLDGRRVLELAPHATLIPLVVLSMAILAFNLLGDAISEVLDPVLRRRA